MTVKSLQVTVNTNMVSASSAYRYGKLVIVAITVNFQNIAVNTDCDLITGLPNIANRAVCNVPNEYGNPGTATFTVVGDKLKGKCTASNAYYYCTMSYFTND